MNEDVAKLLNGLEYNARLIIEESDHEEKTYIFLLPDQRFITFGAIIKDSGLVIYLTEDINYAISSESKTIPYSVMIVFLSCLCAVGNLSIGNMKVCYTSEEEVDLLEYFGKDKIMMRLYNDYKYKICTLKQINLDKDLDELVIFIKKAQDILKESISE